MPHKIKSLIYLSCFVFAAIVYEQASIEPSANLLKNNTELAETLSSDEGYPTTHDATSTK